MFGSDVWFGSVWELAGDADLIGAVDHDQLVDSDRFSLPLEGRHNARNFVAACDGSRVGVESAILNALKVEIAVAVGVCSKDVSQFSMRPTSVP